MVSVEVPMLEERGNQESVERDSEKYTKKSKGD
jgi:hypothetical protein